jgi:phosphomevalonate kinase
VSDVALAPGKAFLTGEYAVLHGGTAIVMAIDRHARARLGTPRQRSPLLAAAAKVSIDHCGPAEVDVDTSAMIGPDGQKLGLGSSAAAVTAAVLMRHHAAGCQLTDDELFVLARRAHARVQPGGSGADVLASVLGGVLEVRRDPESGIEWSPAALPAGLELVFLWTGAAASTPALVAAVGDMAADLVGLAAELSGALLGGERAASLALVERYREELRKLGQDAGVEIITPAHEQVAALARARGGAAKPSGAGGGDLAVAFLWEPEAARALREDARAVGLLPIDLRIEPLGARIASEP